MRAFGPNEGDNVTVNESTARHQARRGDDVEAWLKRWQKQIRDEGGGWTFVAAVDSMLDDYRLHADTGTPLDTEVQER